MAPDPGCGDVVFVLTVLLESRTTAVSFVADGAGEDPFDLGFHFSPSSSAPGSFNTPLILAILDLHHLCFQYHLNSFNTRRLTSSSIGRSIQSTRSNITFLYFCHYAKEIRPYFTFYLFKTLHECQIGGNVRLLLFYFFFLDADRVGDFKRSVARRAHKLLLPQFARLVLTIF